MKKQKKILIVEDEKNLREALVDAFENRKFTSLQAENGKQALSVALSERPDLIILDLLMPEVDGMTAFQALRKNSWGAQVPVIILTNLNPTEQDLVQEVITTAPLFYLIKSDWKLRDIIDKAESAL